MSESKEQKVWVRMPTMFADELLTHRLKRLCQSRYAFRQALLEVWYYTINNIEVPILQIGSYALWVTLRGFTTQYNWNGGLFWTVV